MGVVDDDEHTACGRGRCRLRLGCRRARGGRRGGSTGRRTHAREYGEGLPLAVFQHLEVGFREIEDGFPVAIGDDGVDADDLGLGRRHGGLRGCDRGQSGERGTAKKNEGAHSR